jgi:REP element-mobilizing transposase RayT
MHAHIVFATKNREKLILPAWREKLHEYLGGTVKGLGAVPQGIGGVEDHVHLLVGFKATHRLSDFMQELKKSSSTWVHDEFGSKKFYWQEGYSAFSVSAPARPAVRRYIANQEEHHRAKSHREELIELLERAGIEFDPKFLE